MSEKALGKRPFQHRDQPLAHPTPSEDNPVNDGTASFASRLLQSTSSLARNTLAASSGPSATGDLASFVAGIGEGKGGGASSSSSARAVQNGLDGPVVAQAATYGASRRADIQKDTFHSAYSPPGQDTGIQHEFDTFASSVPFVPAIGNDQLSYFRYETGDLQYQGGASAVHAQDTSFYSDVRMAEELDGMEVVALLDAPATLTTLNDLKTEIEDGAEVSSDDLFPQFATAGPVDSTRQASLHHLHARAHASNFLPPADFEYRGVNGVDVDAWLRDWERVLTSYTEDVWDPASMPWVERARGEIESVKKEEEVGVQPDEAKEMALRRLRMVLGHVRIR